MALKKLIPGEQSLSSLIVPIYFPGFLCFLAEGLTKSFIVLYALEIGAGNALAGVIAALPTLGTIFFDLPAGRLTEKFNRKTVFIISSLAMGLTFILTGLSHTVVLLIPVLMLYGATRASWQIAQISIIRTLVKENARGRALSNVGGLIRIGSFLGPIAAGFIAAHFGISSLFLLAGLLVILSSIYLMLQIPGIEKTEASGERRNVVAALLRYRHILLTAGLGILVLGVLRSARPVLLPLYGEHLGLSLEQIGIIMGIGGLADTLFFYPAGHIYDRFGIHRGAILCITVFSAGLILIPLSGGFISLLAVAALIGVGNGFGSGINMVYSAVLAPENEVGEFMGVWRLFTDAGVFAGPLAAGLITVAAGFTAAPVIIGVIGLSGAVWFKIVERTGVFNKQKRNS